MSDTTGSEDAQDEGKKGAEGDATQGTSSGAQGAAGSQQDASSNDDKDTKGDTVSREEFEAIKRRMQAADQRASKLEQEKEEQARKERTELENTQADLQKAQERIAQLEQALNSTAVETEFVKYGKHDWVDVEAALRLLDREGVEIKDGKVSGLGPAIEKLVKSKPYLVKNNGDQNDSSGASGSASNGRRKGEGGEVKRDLSSRFPALRRPAATK
jgi:hypothetical protein